jgi:hypothetical protein
MIKGDEEVKDVEGTFVLNSRYDPAACLQGQRRKQISLITQDIR